MRARLGREVADEAEEPPGKDAENEELRTLTVDYDGQGEHFKSWKEVCRKAGISEFRDWPLEGPRTTKWWIQQVARRGIGPLARHQTWRHENELEEDCHLCAAREMLSEIMEMAC